MNNIGTDDYNDDDAQLDDTADNGTDLTNNELKQMLKASYQDEPPDDIYGWKYDRDLSNATAKVYYNPNNNFAVVSHRGTKGLKDWKNNLSKNDIVVPAKSINPLKNHDLNILDNAKKKKRKDPLRPLKRLFR